MNDLLNLAINAQGGLDRWRTFFAVSARIHTGGTLWETKGHGGALGDIGFRADLLEQKASFIPSPAWHTVYTPHRVAIETGSDEVVHYLSDYREVSGINIATTRTVYLMGAHNQPRLDAPPVVTIQFKDIQFA
jgi:hypothetical protein